MQQPKCNAPPRPNPNPCQTRHTDPLFQPGVNLFYVPCAPGSLRFNIRYFSKGPGPFNFIQRLGCHFGPEWHFVFGFIGLIKWPTADVSICGIVGIDTPVLATF